MIKNYSSIYQKKNIFTTKKAYSYIQDIEEGKRLFSPFVLTLFGSPCR